MIKNLKNKIWSLDIILLFAYLAVSFRLAYLVEVPSVQNISLLYKIPLVFFGSSLLALFSAEFFSKIFFKNSTFNSDTIKPSNLTYKIIAIVVSSAIFATFISWIVAFSKYSDLLRISPINGMRAITTSLHLLVPLESRILFVLIPIVLLYPAPKKNKLISAIFSFLLLFFAFATQTKLGYLFASLFLFYVIGISNTFFSKNKIKAGILSGLFLLAFTFIGLRLIKNDAPNAVNLVTNKTIKLATSMPFSPSINGRYECSASNRFVYKAETTPTDLSGKAIFEGLLNRAIGTSAQMIRLFVCLREVGWKPNFRGHQLFKLINGYVPYYRYAYEIFRPGMGNAISSAVTNVAADAYFNLGFFGVILSGVTVGLIWFLFKLIVRQPEYFAILIFIKLYLAEILSQLSILSALVTVAPLVCILAFDFAYTKSFKKKLEN